MSLFLKKKLRVEDKLKDITFVDKLDNKPVLKIGVLNLMPNLEDTERDILKLLDDPMLLIEVDFIYLDCSNKDREKQEYLKKYYQSFRDIKNKTYDGFIVTGAPLEHFRFSDINFYQELKEFMEFIKTNVGSTIFLCWAAEFAINYFYDVKRIRLEDKISGLYEHYIINNTSLVRGFDDYFYLPESRYYILSEKDILKKKDLILVGKGNQVGVFLVESKDKKFIFMLGHAEYQKDTLDLEYLRDKKRGLNPKMPVNYYSLEGMVQNKWRSHATLLYHNWLYYYVFKKKLF